MPQSHREMRPCCGAYLDGIADRKHRVQAVWQASAWAVTTLGCSIGVIHPILAGKGTFSHTKAVVERLARRAGKANARAPVSLSMLKQIAGRSGRRNSEYAEGLATALRDADVKTLRKALDAPPSALKTPSAGLFPEFEHLEVPPLACTLRLNFSCPFCKTLLQLLCQHASVIASMFCTECK